MMSWRQRMRGDATMEVKEEEALRMLDEDEIKAKKENSDTHQIPTIITASFQPHSALCICPTLHDEPYIIPPTTPAMPASPSVTGTKAGPHRRNPTTSKCFACRTVLGHSAVE